MDRKELKEYAGYISSLMNPNVADIDLITNSLTSRDWEQEELVVFANFLLEKVKYPDSDKYYDEYEGPHSSDLLPEIVKILLKLGLNPNSYDGEDNIFSGCMWIEVKDNNVRTLKVLLDAGADPNLHIPYEYETVFEMYDWMTCFDMFFESWVKASMLLSVYGGYYRFKYENKEVPNPPPLEFVVYDEVKYPRDWFKNIDAFTIEVEKVAPGLDQCWKGHIVDKSTGKRIGWYGIEK